MHRFKVGDVVRADDEFLRENPTQAPEADPPEDIPVGTVVAYLDGGVLVNFPGSGSAMLPESRLTLVEHADPTDAAGTPAD